MITKEQLPENLKTSFDSIAGKDALAQLPVSQPSQVPAQPTPFAPSIANASRNAIGRVPAASPAPGSFGSKLGAALDQTPLELAPNGKPEPGSWAKTLVGAAQKVLSGAQDISTTPTEQTSGFGGFVEGFAQTGANQNARQVAEAKVQAAQKQQSTENAQEQKKLDLQAEQVASQIAYNNVQKMQTEQIMANTTEANKMASAVRGKKEFDDMQSGEVPWGEVVNDRVTEDDLHDNILQEKIKTHEVEAIKISREEVNGQMQDIYAVVKPVGDRVVNKDQSDRIEKYTGQKITEGSSVNSVKLRTILQEADGKEAATLARNKFLKENTDLEQGKIDKLGAVNLSPDAMRALAESNGDYVKAAAILGHKFDEDPEFAKKNPNWFPSYIRSIGGGDFETGQTAWNAALTRRTQEKIAADQLAKKEALNTKELGDLSLAEKGDKQGYWNSIPAPARSTVQAFGEGRLDPGSLSYLASKNQPLLDAITYFYPDLDSGKAKNYPTLVKQFSTGAEGRSLSAVDAMMRHIRNLWDLTTPSSLVPGSPDSGKRASTLSTVVEERAKFYKGSASATDEDKKEGRKILEEVAPWNRGNVIKDQAHLIADKLLALENQWKNGSPSEVFQPHMPDISDEAKKSLLYIKNGGVEPTFQQWYDYKLQEAERRGAVGAKTDPNTGKKFFVNQYGTVLGEIPVDTKKKGPVNIPVDNSPQGGGM